MRNFDSNPMPTTKSNPEPFTYEHFLLALRSCKDDMLMYYIDEAVGIYCRLRGISVGRRPANPGDYSQQYAIAYEAANYAVWRVSTKIGAYSPDPKKGTFKQYLDTSLTNALKDILKEDGIGDFFDQTSKKKKSEPEPETHRRVDVDYFWGATEQTKEPDDDVAEREARIRKHQDEALETMINYIDTLPAIKRAAIYASAFGQALRPDLEGFGRNYADVLAQMYGTTAEYIRKLAAEGKKAALEKAREEGYGEDSMAGVSMSFLQVVQPTPDINDMVLKAVGELDPYHQFLLLRHLAR